MSLRENASFYAVTIIWNLAQVLVPLLVLFHTYASEDMAIVVALLVMLYGMTMGWIHSGGATFTKCFVHLAKLLRHGEDDLETEPLPLRAFLRPLETYAEEAWPHYMIFVAFSWILAFIAGVKLLITLVS